MPPEKIVSPPDLRAFFARLVLPGFAELGIADRAVSDYVIDLLARFARTDQLYRAVEIRRYVGDYALFSSGLFRVWVEWQGLGDYSCEQGRAAYAAAAEMAQLSYGGEADSCVRWVRALNILPARSTTCARCICGPSRTGASTAPCCGKSKPCKGAIAWARHQIVVRPQICG